MKRFIIIAASLLWGAALFAQELVIRIDDMGALHSVNEASIITNFTPFLEAISEAISPILLSCNASCTIIFLGISYDFPYSSLLVPC